MAVVDTLEIQVSGNGVAELTNAIRSLADSLKKVTAPAKQATEGAKDAGKAAEGLSKKLGGVAKAIGRIMFYRAIRGAIKGISEAFSEGAENAYWFSKSVGGDLYKTLTELSTANYKLTNQMGAAWATLLQTVTPILTQIVSLISTVFQYITQFFAALSGKSTYLKAIDYTKEWATQTSSGAKSAKEWKNQLLSFDEINKLTDNSGTTSSGGTSTPDYSKMFEDTPLDEWTGKVSKIGEFIKTNLAAIELAVAGSLLALGALLTFSGVNIPLGLALIAAGVVGLVAVKKADWSGVSENVEAAILSIMQIVAIGSVAIGAVLLFSGHPALGLGLIMAGIGIQAAVDVGWDVVPENVQATVTKITGIVSEASLALGAVLLFSGVASGIGLGLIALGATTLVGQMAANWSSTTEEVRKQMSEIETLAGSFSLAIGIILCAFGNLPLGIPLLALGAISLGKGIWDGNPGSEIVQKLTEMYNSVVGFWNSSFLPFLSSAKQSVVDFFSWEFSFNASGPSTHSNSTLGTYASGGFPGDSGELFVANESGPELVGKIGNQNAVANTQQIVEAISLGVYEAVSSAMSGSNENVVVKLNLDGREIANAVTKRQKQSSRAMGV